MQQTALDDSYTKCMSDDSYTKCVSTLLKMQEKATWKTEIFLLFYYYILILTVVTQIHMQIFGTNTQFLSNFWFDNYVYACNLKYGLYRWNSAGMPPLLKIIKHSETISKPV